MLGAFIQRLRVFRIHALPVGVAAQGLPFLTEAFDVVGQRGLQFKRLGPGLGRQNFNTLGHQQGRFAQYLGTVRQIFNVFDPVGQRQAQTCERFTRQRCAGLGGVARPSHGVSHVQSAGSQQGTRFFRPFLGQSVLGFGATQFVDFFFHRFGCTLVARAQFFENCLQHIKRRLGV